MQQVIAMGMMILGGGWMLIGWFVSLIGTKHNAFYEPLNNRAFLNAMFSLSFMLTGAILYVQ